jgi:hypothetical protein
MKAIALAALFVAGVAHADEVVIHTLSWHSKPMKDYTVRYIYPDGSFAYEKRVTEPYNNVNPGLGYRWDNGWNVGYYHNSYSRSSLYFVKDWQWTRRFGFMLGAATGYKDENRTGIMPLAGFTFRQPLTERTILGIQYAPAIGNHTAVVHATISYSLHK